MNRRQIAFILLMNALISLAIALAVAWAIEARRPDVEEMLIALQDTGASVPVVVTPIVTAPTATPATVADPPPTQEPAIAPTPVISSELQTYTVQVGDTLGGIANKFNVSVADIIAVNPELRANPDLLFSGLPLIIPKAGAAELVATPTSAETASTEILVEISGVETPGNLISEKVQIVNDGQRELNLNGWQLRRENGPSYTFGNVPLFPGSGIWLHSRAGDDTTVAVYWAQPSAVWTSGGLVQLINPEGAVVTSYLVP